MFNKLSSLILSVLLFLVFLGSVANLSVVGISILLLMISATVINYKRLGFSWPHLLLPCLYLLGIGGIFVIIPSVSIRLLFLVASVLVFFLLEANLGKESHLLQNIYLFSVFAIYLGIFALQFYFHLNTGQTILLVFPFTYLFALQGFSGFILPAKKYFVFLITLVCTEAAVGLILWPTHYLVNAVVLFSIFYILWMFAFSIFFGKLNLQKIMWQLTLIGIVLVITLSSAVWRPLNR